MTNWCTKSMFVTVIKLFSSRTGSNFLKVVQGACLENTPYVGWQQKKEKKLLTLQVAFLIRWFIMIIVRVSLLIWFITWEKLLTQLNWETCLCVTKSPHFYKLRYLHLVFTLYWLKRILNSLYSPLTVDQQS